MTVYINLECFIRRKWSTYPPCRCGSRIAKRADHGERVEPQRVPGAEPLVGVRRRSPPPLKLKAFRLYSYKNGPKVKYLNKRIPHFWPTRAVARSAHVDPPVLLGKVRQIKPAQLAFRCTINITLLTYLLTCLLSCCWTTHSIPVSDAVR